MNGFMLDVTNNVKVTVFDSNHNLKKIVTKHNKATKNLVTGLIKFLRGEFTPSNLNQDYNSGAAVGFIPAYISFGDGGLQQLGKKISENDYVSDVQTVMANLSTLTPTTFATKDLQHEIVGNVGNEDTPTAPTHGRCKITRTSYGGSTSDTITLNMTSLITKGYYSKNFYLDDVENGNRYKYVRGSSLPIYLSELGLWADEYSNVDINSNYKGNLLARVTFEDEDSIVQQSDSDIILVEWKIEITSIDENYSQDNITNIIWNNDN